MYVCESKVYVLRKMNNSFVRDIQRKQKWNRNILLDFELFFFGKLSEKKIRL